MFGAAYLFSSFTKVASENLTNPMGSELLAMGPNSMDEQVDRTRKDRTKKNGKRTLVDASRRGEHTGENMPTAGGSADFCGRRSFSKRIVAAGIGHKQVP